MTASSASSSNIHYTMKKPYESTILNARYLTKTPIDGAKGATDILYKNDNVDDKSITNNGEAMLLSAMKQFENKFPLTTSKIIGKEVVTDDQCIRNGKRVVEMTLSLPDDFTLEYQPGDSIGLISSNSIQASQFILSLLQDKHQISKSQLLSVNEGDATTVEDIVCNYIDLCTPIKNKKILSSIAKYASDMEEAAALNLLASSTTLGQQLFQTFITEQRITVVDIMKLFPSCQTISIDGLLGILPQIPPRYYSICSSPLGTEISSSLSVAFSVVDYMTPKLNIVGEPQRRMAGLTTTFLETICSQFLDKSDKTTNSISTTNDIPKIKIFPKAADEFRLPSDLSTPMILIGPGTGIAPFIGFVEHRRAQRMNKETTTATKSISQGTWRGGFDIEEEESSAMANCTLNEKKYGNIDLYFGCRHSNHDWLYEDEMKSLKDQGIISNLTVAFSRDDVNSKCYVQDKIKDNAKHIGEMIVHDNASIYICGDGNSMAKDVQVALQSALDEYYASHVPDSDKPRQSVATLKAEKRLLLDIWS
jgi:sulfite reductase alpha subunit-like flavoprotein